MQIANSKRPYTPGVMRTVTASAAASKVTPVVPNSAVVRHHLTNQDRKPTVATYTGSMVGLMGGLLTGSIGSACSFYGLQMGTLLPTPVAVPLAFISAALVGLIGAFAGGRVAGFITRGR